MGKWESAGAEGLGERHALPGFDFQWQHSPESFPYIFARLRSFISLRVRIRRTTAASTNSCSALNYTLKFSYAITS